MAIGVNSFWRDLLLPRHQPLLPLAGVGIGVFGDVVDFFTNFFPRGAIVALFVIFACGTLYLCWKIATRQSAAPLDPAPDGTAALPAIDCPECNATRFGIFATIAFGFLTVIGQGESATERLGTQLGLIQRDVTVIKDALEGQTLIDNPKTAAERFHNAFIYRHYRNDTAGAAREIGAVYEGEAPKKMDAAQMYFDALSVTKSRPALVAEMEAMAERTGDATLLIVAARGADDPAKSEQLVLRAREMDPTLPFAWWDPLVPQTMSTASIVRPQDEAARLRKEIARIEKYQALSISAPIGNWFFMPQMVGDYGSSATMMLNTYRRVMTQYDDMASGKFQREVREKLIRERAMQGR